MTYEKISGNPVLLHAFNFSLSAIEYAENLNKAGKYVVGKQLLRSATSIGANLIEAQSAESRADFFHKCKIAMKESEESEYWILLCKMSPGYPDPGKLPDDIRTLAKIIGKIISNKPS